MTGKSVMPEVIYAWKNEGTFWTVEGAENFTGESQKTKYVRADKSDHLRKALEGAVEALTRADKFFFNSTVCGNDLSDLADEMQKAIAAAEEALK